MSNDPVASAGSSPYKSPPLTDAQVDAFWVSFLAHRDSAQRAARVVAPRMNADDIVHSAAILFLESFTRWPKPAKYPKSDADFRRQLLAVVRNHARDCVRDKGTVDRPVHAHWGTVKGPAVGGRKIADRPLDQVFVRNDRDLHDAEEPEAYPVIRHEDDLWAILDECSLATVQWQIVMAIFFEGFTRQEIADALGITVRTCDNHLQAAFKSMRSQLSIIVDASTNPGRAYWYERIRAMEERHKVAHLQRVAKKNADRSAKDVDRSASEGDAGKSGHADAA